MSMEESTILQIDPALPCVAWISDGVECGKPAHVAYADRVRGQWVLTPICRDCTVATAKVYGVEVDEKQ